MLKTQNFALVENRNLKRSEMSENLDRKKNKGNGCGARTDGTEKKSDRSAYPRYSYETSFSPQTKMQMHAQYEKLQKDPAVQAYIKTRDEHRKKLLKEGLSAKDVADGWILLDDGRAILRPGGKSFYADDDDDDYD